MSKLVILVLAFLILSAPMALAVYSVEKGGFLYGVRYSVFSNGTSALINAEVDNYGVTCGMDSCWAEVYDVYDYLLFFDGSRLYFLNFTPALLSSLPPYAPRNVSWVYFNGVKYVNGSWYVNMSVFAYSAKTQKASNLHYVFRLNTENFCVKRANVSWSRLKGSAFKGEISGWRIEIPREFRAKAVFVNGTWVQINETSPPPLSLSADFLIAKNASVFNSSYVKPWMIRDHPHFIPNSSRFSVYFLLEEDDRVRKVTLFYINTTSGLNGFWFPDSVRIVNVIVCKSNNVTSSEISTTEARTATKKSICGPGLAVLLTLSVALIEKRRR